MKTFFDKTYQDNHGVYRWKSNNHVPPIESMEGQGIDADLVDACQVVREMEQAEFLADYIASIHEPTVAHTVIVERRAHNNRGDT